MRAFSRLCPALIGSGLLAIAAGTASAGDQPQPARPELVPAEVPVADLGQSASLDPSIPFDPGLTTWFSSSLGPPPLPNPDQAAALLYPLAMAAEGQDPWGWRFSSSRGRWRMHTGLDLVAPRGTPVLAVLPGRVHLVSWIDGYGLTVVLDHGGGRRSLYGHLEAVAVRPGQWLQGGEVMAAVGSTGRSSGPHLHFEWRQQQGADWVARDPTPLLPTVLRTPLLASGERNLKEPVVPEGAGASAISIPPLPPPLLARDGP